MQNKAKRKIDYKKVAWCLAMMVLGSMMFIMPAFADTVSASQTMNNLIIANLLNNAVSLQR